MFSLMLCRGTLNLLSRMSGATVCGFTIWLNAAWAGRPTFNLQTGGTNHNISWCVLQLKWKPAYFGPRRHMIERCFVQHIEKCSCWRKHFIFHIAGRDVGCCLSFTKGTSKSFCLSFCFCLLIFSFFVHLFLKFWRHIVLFKYTLYKIYIY